MEMEVPEDTLTMGQAKCIMSHFRNMLRDLMNYKKTDTQKIKEKKKWITLKEFCSLYSDLDPLPIRWHLTAKKRQDPKSIKSCARIQKDKHGRKRWYVYDSLFKNYIKRFRR